MIYLSSRCTIIMEYNHVMFRVENTFLFSLFCKLITEAQESILYIPNYCNFIKRRKKKIMQRDDKKKEE